MRDWTLHYADLEPIMTNGLVSFVRDGKVILKVVVGCDGYNAAQYADAVVRGGDYTVKGAIRARSGIAFGNDRSFVAMDDQGGIAAPVENDPEIEDLPPLYREKFHDPRFNPRWQYGTAEYTEVREVTINDTALSAS